MALTRKLSLLSDLNDAHAALGEMFVSQEMLHLGHASIELEPLRRRASGSPYYKAICTECGRDGSLLSIRHEGIRQWRLDGRILSRICPRNLPKQPGETPTGRLSAMRHV